MRQCAFCPETANLTGEHLWSAWISEILNVKKFWVSLNEGGIRKQWGPLPSLNQKANVVCRRCNNGWMSDLESQVKPLLTNIILYGSGLSILPSGIRTLAAFSFKNLVVAHAMDTKRKSPFITRLQQRDFAHTKIPPSDVQMWIAGTNDYRGIYKTWQGKVPIKTYDAFELYVFTYAVGFLVIQVTVSRWMNRGRRRHDLPPLLNQGAYWDDASIPFWPPPAKHISWPAPKILSGDSVNQFVQRWKDVRV
jgi:hypothetical protein